MTDRAHMPKDSKIPNLLCFEELVDAQDDAFVWPTFDENQASSLCYTSGTPATRKACCTAIPRRCCTPLRSHCPMR